MATIFKLNDKIFWLLLQLAVNHFQNHAFIAHLLDVVRCLAGKISWI